MEFMILIKLNASFPNGNIFPLSLNSILNSIDTGLILESIFTIEIENVRYFNGVEIL